MSPIQPPAPPASWGPHLAQIDGPAAVVQAGRIAACNDAMRSLVPDDLSGEPEAALVGPDGEAGPKVPLGWMVQSGPGPAGTSIVRLAQADPDASDHYRRLFDQAAGPMLILDGRGRIEEANEGAGELLGCPPPQLVGMHLEELLARSRDGRRLQRALATVRDGDGHVAPDHDWSLRCLDGRDVPVSVAFRRTSPHGEMRISVSLHGMTQRVHQEEYLQDLLMELVRTNEDLANFANQVAHDLQPPLRSMAMLQRHMREHWPDAPESALQCMTDAEAGARRLHEMVSALKELCRVRQEPLQCGWVEMEQVVDDVRTLLAAEISERGARVVVHDLPRVWADQGMMTAALQNLVSNSLKYCAGRPEVHVRSRQDGDRCLIDVEDNGIGIDPARAEQMFDTFWRGHPGHSASGSGLGLSLVRRVIHRHGGHVMPQPLPDGGTRMRLAIPSADAALSDASTTAVKYRYAW